MITCHKAFLEARCQERGYTLDEVMPCVVSQTGNEWTIDPSHPAYPKEHKAKQGLPPLFQRVKNFAKAATAHVASGMPMATDEQIAARWAICNRCEHLQKGACVLCGCPVVRERQFISKLSWAKESCPAGKWGPEIPAVQSAPSET